jgi:GH43 family beta-xylosidase
LFEVSDNSTFNLYNSDRILSISFDDQYKYYLRYETRSNAINGSSNMYIQRDINKASIKIIAVGGTRTPA